MVPTHRPFCILLQCLLFHWICKAAVLVLELNWENWLQRRRGPALLWGAAQRHLRAQIRIWNFFGSSVPFSFMAPRGKERTKPPHWLEFARCGLCARACHSLLYCTRGAQDKLLRVPNCSSVPTFSVWPSSAHTHRTLFHLQTDGTLKPRPRGAAVTTYVPRGTRKALFSRDTASSAHLT